MKVALNSLDSNENTTCAFPVNINILRSENMHTPRYSFLLHLFGCNTVPSIMEIGALFEYVLPLLTCKRMRSSSLAKLARITVPWKHFCEPDADFTFLKRLENSISTCS